MDTQAIISALEKLAAKLGTTAEYLWPKFVGNVVIENILMLITTTLLAIILASFVPVWVKYAKKAESGTDTRCGFIALIVIFTALTIVAIGLALSSIPNIMYPEPQALKDLAGMFK